MPPINITKPSTSININSLIAKNLNLFGKREQKKELRFCPFLLQNNGLINKARK